MGDMKQSIEALFSQLVLPSDPWGDAQLSAEQVDILVDWAKLQLQQKGLSPYRQLLLQFLAHANHHTFHNHVRDALHLLANIPPMQDQWHMQIDLFFAKVMAVDEHAQDQMQAALDSIDDQGAWSDVIKGFATSQQNQKNKKAFAEIDSFLNNIAQSKRISAKTAQEMSVFVQKYRQNNPMWWQSLSTSEQSVWDYLGALTKRSDRGTVLEAVGCLQGQPVQVKNLSASSRFSKRIRSKVTLKRLALIKKAIKQVNMDDLNPDQQAASLYLKQANAFSNRFTVEEAFAVFEKRKTLGQVNVGLVSVQSRFNQVLKDGNIQVPKPNKPLKAVGNTQRLQAAHDKYRHDDYGLHSDL